MSNYRGYRVAADDTYAMLQQRQLEQQALKRAQERKDAKQVLDEFGRRNSWSQDDVNTVTAALGLEPDAEVA